MSAPSHHSQKASIPSMCPETAASSSLHVESVDMEQQVATPDKAEAPYSHFSTRARVTIVVIAALSGLVSPLSANMYYPSIQSVREDLHASQTAITWTITAYIIAMAVFPLIWSNCADQIGRKPVYALSMVIYTCGSIGCALSNNLSALIASRVVQSMGASAVQGAGAGTISDIYPRDQRGTALGIYYLGPLLGPALGPIVGGYIGQSAGWRWVFWMLSIWGGVMFLLATFVLPETHRRLVSKKHRIQQINIPPPLSLKENNPLADIALVRYPVVALCMFAFAVLFGAYFGNATAQPLAYEGLYGLSQGVSGICYLPSGVGCIVGSVVGGRVTDLLLGRRQRALQRSLAVAESGQPMQSVKAPPEARLEATWIGAALFLCALLAGGWIVEHRLPLAGFLVVQFFIGMGMAFSFQCLGGYLIDVFPTKSARITGVQNFWRSAWAAVIVQLFPTMIDRIGWGWSYTVMFFLTLASFSLLQIVVFRGGALRQRYGPAEIDMA